MAVNAINRLDGGVKIFANFRYALIEPVKFS